ncbi:MAG: ATP-binding protein, partial [Gammaproteobacteria bacterium]
TYIVRLIQQRREIRRQITLLSQRLERALPAKPPQKIELSDLGNDLGSLRAPLNQLLASVSGQNQDRYQVLKELARGLNHNMNNLLFGILGAAQLIQRHSGDEQIQSWAEVVHKDGERLTELVKQLTYAVTEHFDQTPENVDLNSIISTLLDQHQPRWLEAAHHHGHVIRFHTQLAAGCPPIRANGASISGLIEHLIQNAVDALPGDGSITLRTFQTNPTELSIEIRDDGIGMDGETRRRIFDPFFTTKKALGTGLGLSEVMTTALQWDATVDVTSEVGLGTSFIVTFPVEDRENPTEESDEPTRRHARVLVVDDQRAIGEVISNSLSENFEVTVFEDGESAIRAFEPGRWDVAMIDLELPGISGDQLAQRLGEHDPDIVRILMTGWALDLKDPRREPFELYLQKPVTNIKMLNRVISDALRHSGRGSEPS